MNVIIVLGAMLIYGLVHSILASKEAKRAFRSRFGDRAYEGLYRLSFNVFAVVSFVPIAWLVVFQEGGTIWEIPLAWEPVLLLIQGIGLLGLGVSLLQIDVMRFAGISQAWAYLTGRELPLPLEKLQKGGLYGWVRHPLYLFSLIVLWPVTSMTDSYFGFALGATIYFLIGSYYEEKRMLSTYGDSYREYRQRVPWLIPLPRFTNKS
ncbi:MAG: methyltransferase family protein [Chloroflexota bacterium]